MGEGQAIVLCEANVVRVNHILLTIVIPSLSLAQDKATIRNPVYLDSSLRWNDKGWVEGRAGSKPAPTEGMTKNKDAFS
jgi:hypothetical protein